MTTLLIALLAGVAFIVAYHTYGRWLGHKIFSLSVDAVCPSVRLNDGLDYVPTRKSIVFGHHFTSIAGTGPIVGPAIAIMWGWLPALLWVVFGSIFIGAVHDLGALVVSLRNNGQTVGDIAGRVLNRRVRLLFLLILFMALTIVLAIFGWVIAKVFQLFPSAIFPCIVQVPLALAIGVWLYRRGKDLLFPSIIALAVMYLSVIYGDSGFLHPINQYLAGLPIFFWVALLLAYSYVASVLPVWTLLQPRDYINSLQLISALGLIVLGLAWAAAVGGAPLVEGGPRPELQIAAEWWRPNPAGAPPIFPFLFITIACGAISGFHCLVSSGTSSKQIQKEPDARLIAYGGMLLEGFLATLVILACIAGLGLGVQGAAGPITGSEAWLSRYVDWKTVANGAIGSFVLGAANFLMALGIPGLVSTALMGVLVASFAGTTLDTACRLQRYVIQELANTLNFAKPSKLPVPRQSWSPLRLLQNKHGATLLAVAVAAVLAAIPSDGNWSWATAGTGGLILWPLFGATNQLLGGLAFLVIAFYLWRRRTPVWFLVIPLIIMLVMPAWAMATEIGPWWQAKRYVLCFIAASTLVLEVWMLIEALLLWPRVRGVLEENAIHPAAIPAIETLQPRA